MARTFKDDVLALYHGENKSTLVYFAVILLNDHNIDIERHEMQYDDESCWMNTRMFPLSEGIHAYHKERQFNLKMPRGRRQFTDYFFRNCFRDTVRGIPDVLISHNLKAYYPYTSSNVKVLRQKIRDFNKMLFEFRDYALLNIDKEYFKVMRAYSEWLFQCIFFNKYSDVGVLDKWFFDFRKLIVSLENVISNADKFKEMSKENMHDYFLMKKDFLLLLKI